MDKRWDDHIWDRLVAMHAVYSAWQGTNTSILIKPGPVIGEHELAVVWFWITSRMDGLRQVWILYHPIYSANQG